MGWWGTNVMEGDPPMDAECDILDFLGDIHAERTDGEKIDDDGQAQLVQLLKEEGVASDVLARLKGMDGDEDDLRIAIQVLGEILICNGFPMPDDLRAAAIQAAKDDDWASEDDERRESMEAYAKRVADYNGVAVEPVSRGLFDVIDEALSAIERVSSTVDPNGHL